MPRPSAPIGGRPFTGRARFRRTLFGRLVLQLEEEVERDPAMPQRPNPWRDAGELDLWRLRAERKHAGLEPLI
jgi:hypothetical protein